jgi:apolipoprotein N-acyltransferase
VRGGAELLLGGVAGLAALSVVVKARAGARRAKLAAEIARVGTSPASLLGRVVGMAVVIVGVQWLVITHSTNRTLVCVVLGLPALVVAYTLTKATTVTQIRPSSPPQVRGRR